MVHGGDLRSEDAGRAKWRGAGGRSSR